MQRVRSKGNADLGFDRGLNASPGHIETGGGCKLATTRVRNWAGRHPLRTLAERYRQQLHL